MGHEDDLRLLERFVAKTESPSGQPTQGPVHVMPDRVIEAIRTRIADIDAELVLNITKRASLVQSREYWEGLFDRRNKEVARRTDENNAVYQERVRQEKVPWSFYGGENRQRRDAGNSVYKKISLEMDREMYPSKEAKRGHWTHDEVREKWGHFIKSVELIDDRTKALQDMRDRYEAIILEILDCVVKNMR